MGILDLFKSIEFSSLMSVGVSCGYNIIGWMMYLVPQARNVGFEPYDAAMLATVGGIGFVVGTAIFAIL